MWARAIFVVVGLMAGAPAIAEPMPAGWRAATPSDVDAVAERLKMTAADRFMGQTLSAVGDFDGDGRADRAAVLVNDNGARLGVFLFRGAGGAPKQLDDEPIDSLVNIGLDTQPAGKFATACGKGVGAKKAPCSASVSTRHAVVSLIHFEAAQEIIYWTGRGFERAFLSD